MDYQIALDWFEDAATRWPDIAHKTDKEANRRFYRSPDEFAKQESLLPANVWFMVMDDPSGALSGQMNVNIRDGNEFGFWILHQVSKNDFADEDVKYRKAKQIAFKIIGKALLERYNGEGPFITSDIDRTEYDRAVNVKGKYHGIYCSMVVHTTVNNMVAYNANEWLPLPEPE